MVYQSKIVLSCRIFGIVILEQSNVSHEGDDLNLLLSEASLTDTNENSYKPQFSRLLIVFKRCKNMMNCLDFYTIFKIMKQIYAMEVYWYHVRI